MNENGDSDGMGAYERGELRQGNTWELLLLSE